MIGIDAEPKRFANVTTALGARLRTTLAIRLAYASEEENSPLTRHVSILVEFAIGQHFTASGNAGIWMVLENHIGRFPFVDEKTFEKMTVLESMIFWLLTGFIRETI